MEANVVCEHFDLLFCPQRVTLLTTSNTGNKQENKADGRKKNITF